MALAVCLLFDPRGERLVRGLWARLESIGVRTLQSHTHARHHPHLSYAVALEWDLARVQEAMGALPDRGPFEVSVQGALTFPRGRVALAPAVPAAVAARQETVFAVLRDTGAVAHRHYAPGRWVPHVSVATRATGATLPTVVTAVADVVPMTLRVDRAALVDSATGQTWRLGTIP
jgi:2'-5' RNA ligase